MTQEAQQAHWEIEAIVLHERRAQEAARYAGQPLYLAGEAAFRALTQQPSPEGVLAILPFPPAAHWQPQAWPALPEGPGFVLEDIQDPGNLGTIIRTADWLGFRAVVCSKGCVDVLNPKVLRSSMGSFFRVSVAYTEHLVDTLAPSLDRLWAADMVGTPLPKVPFRPHDYVLLGNESRGVSAEVRALPGLRRLHIPGRGGAESLNAAMAAAMSGWQLFCKAFPG